MKNYKFLLVSLFFLTPFFYSCNEDSFDLTAEDNSEIYRTPEFFQKSVSVISEDIQEKLKNSKGEEEYELTQAELDQYITISGYSGTVPPLSQVNDILNDVMTETENYDGDPQGYEPIDTAPLRQGTKDLLMQIMENGPIQDLKSNSNYTIAPISEQQLVEYINNLYYAWENGDINFDFYDTGGRGGTRWLAFAALGGIIGYSTAGVPGMIIGGIVGGVFGLITGGK